jgi:ABC-2 type transport system ATP-binding protein
MQVSHGRGLGRTRIVMRHGRCRTDTVIDVRDLHKAYGDKIAVDGISFEVRRGEIFGIVGPNGAGKTTTVECIIGLRQPDRGRISVLDLDAQRDAQRLKRLIGVQLQEASLPNRVKVWEALDLFASLYEQPADWRDLLDQWGLSDRRDAPFAKLSGGQKQRLFIAIALLNRPEIVFFDEITTGLDPQARRATWELIESIREQGTTIVLVTHFMEEAERLCDRVAIVDQGRVVALDSPQALAGGSQAETQIRFSLPDGDADLSWLDSVAGVSRVERDGGAVTVFGSGPLLVRVATALSERGLEPSDLRMEKRTLEDVFLARTGREMRD